MSFKLNKINKTHSLILFIFILLYFFSFLTFYGCEKTNEYIQYTLRYNANLDEEWRKSELLGTLQNSGTAAALCGNSLVVNIFLSDTSSSWTSADIENALGYLNKALDFLKNEAFRYGKAVEFDVLSMDDSIKIKYSKTLPNSASDIEILEDIIFESGIDFFSEEYLYKISENYDNAIFLFYINGNGRSFSLPYSRENDDNRSYFSERAVLFYNSEENNEPYKYRANPAVYAHEILHLFGAYDLYFENDSNLENDISALDILIEKLFPSDIMHKAPFNINNAEIGDFTAFCVGLSSELSDSAAEIYMKMDIR